MAAHYLSKAELCKAVLPYEEKIHGLLRVCVTPGTKYLKEITKPGGEYKSRRFPKRCEFVEGGLCSGASALKCCMTW